MKRSQLWKHAAETSSRRKSNKLENDEKYAREGILVDVLVVRPLDGLDAACVEVNARLGLVAIDCEAIIRQDIKGGIVKRDCERQAGLACRVRDWPDDRAVVPSICVGDAACTEA